MAKNNSTGANHSDSIAKKSVAFHSFLKLPVVTTKHLQLVYGISLVVSFQLHSHTAIASTCGAMTAETNSTEEKKVNTPNANFNPNSPVRANAILNRGLHRIEVARKKYGTKNGRLVHELQNLWGFYGFHGDPNKSLPFYKEWLTVYPHIPSEDQRSYARHALYSARELLTYKPPSAGMRSLEQANLTELAVDIVRCVLTAMNARGADWTPYDDLTEELQNVTTIIEYPQELREQARIALNQKMRPDVSRAKTILHWFEEVDLSDKNITSEARSNLVELGRLFEKFRGMDKHDLTAKYLETTAKSMQSDLRPDAEKLLWRVYKQIDPAWIDNGSIVSGLCFNASFYWQKEEDFAKVAKLFKKATAIEDYDKTGDYSSVNRHEVLGDVYVKLDRKKDARREYEYARMLNNRMMTNGTFDGLQTDGLEMQETELKKRLDSLK